MIMDYRFAIQFLAEHFPNTPLRHIMAVADDLVRATTPPTLKSICENVFTEYHRDHKIVFIKDVREVAKTHDIGYGLKECKDAVEAFLAAHPAAEQVEEFHPWEEDEDGSLAYARMLERRSDPYFQLDNEEPPF
jgi:ribosomal protein L7/L12